LTKFVTLNLPSIPHGVILNTEVHDLSVYD